MAMLPQDDVSDLQGSAKKMKTETRSDSDEDDQSGLSDTTLPWGGLSFDEDEQSVVLPLPGCEDEHLVVLPLPDDGEDEHMIELPLLRDGEDGHPVVLPLPDDYEDVVLPIQDGEDEHPVAPPLPQDDEDELPDDGVPHPPEPPLAQDMGPMLRHCPGGDGLDRNIQVHHKHIFKTAVLWFPGLGQRGCCVLSLLLCLVPRMSSPCGLWSQTSWCNKT